MTKTNRAIKYFVPRLNKYCTINELHKITGLEYRLIYERINKLGWPLDKVILTPVRQKRKIINTNKNVDKKDIKIKSPKDLISTRYSNFCQPDYIGYDKENNIFIIKFIDVDSYEVTPSTSHPYRYPNFWYVFYELLTFTKKLNGYLYIINYNSRDDSEFKIIKVINYNLQEIIKHLRSNNTYSKYLNIEEEKVLNKEEFTIWINDLNSYNKQIMNNTYKHLKSFSLSQYKPNYYKDPIKCKDHLGNLYSSKAERCRVYNKKPSTVEYRLKSGQSLEEALTKPVKKHIKKGENK